MQNRPLSIGFFKEFKGRDTVLFSGDADAMRKIAAVFFDLTSGAFGRVSLESLPFVTSRQVTMSAEASPSSVGMRYVAESGPPWFSWRLRPNDWEDVAFRLGPFAAGSGGHVYLDYLGVLDDVQVMFSVNEYPDSWW
jgi:hypothetical protein